jgi:hypothetical protein
MTYRLFFKVISSRAAKIRKVENQFGLLPEVSHVKKQEQQTFVQSVYLKRTENELHSATIV